MSGGGRKSRAAALSTQAAAPSAGCVVEVIGEPMIMAVEPDPDLRAVLDADPGSWRPHIVSAVIGERLGELLLDLRNDADRHHDEIRVVLEAPAAVELHADRPLRRPAVVLVGSGQRSAAARTRVEVTALHLASGASKRLGPIHAVVPGSLAGTMLELGWSARSPAGEVGSGALRVPIAERVVTATLDDDVRGTLGA